MTARQVIYRACRLLGYARQGMSLPADLESDGLDALNDMIGTWRNESLLVFAIRADIFTLSVNVQAYTIGSGATFNAPRPTYIKDANLVLQQTTPAVRLPLEILRDSSEWAAIRVRAITNSLPLKLYYDPTMPNGTINLWPAPLLAYQLELFSWAQLDRFADIATTNYTFPDGYDDAIRHNLAVALAPMIPDKMRQGRLDMVVARSRELKAILKAHNSPTKKLYSDAPGGLGAVSDSSYFNYRSGNLRMAG